MEQRSWGCKERAPANAIVDAAVNAGKRGMCLYICVRCGHRQEDVNKAKWGCTKCGAKYDTTQEF